MNTRTIKSKTLGIFLSLTLVLSLVAVLLPATPVEAAITGVTIQYPTSSNITYIRNGGTVDVQYTLVGAGSYDVETFIMNDSTTVGSSGIQNESAGIEHDLITVPVAAEGTYKVYVNVASGTETATNLGAVVVDNTAPTVTVANPAGGEYWGSGSSQTIGWTATDATLGNLTIAGYYSTNSGVTWSALGGGFTGGSLAQGYNSSAWTVPDIDSTTCRVRIQATDACGNSANTTSAANFTIIHTAPTVTVIVPSASSLSYNGGVEYDGTGTNPIQFSATGTVSPTLDYLVQISSTGGASYSANITSGTYDWLMTQSPGTVALPWTVTNTVRGPNCKIKVWARDLAGKIGSDVSNNNFTINDVTAPTVTVSAPASGDVWYAGSTQTITWTATDNVPGALTYTLYYSTDGGSTYPGVNVIATANTAQGYNTQSWTIPGGVSSTTCKVKVTATDAASTPNSGNDESDQFEIRSDTTPPTVTVTAPNGGQSWQGGTAQTISWTASDTPSNTATLDYTLYYSTNGGAAWTTIGILPGQDQFPSTARTFTWMLPDVTGTPAPDTNCKVKVMATDLAGNTAFDVSDATFTITAVTDPGYTTDTSTLKASWNFISLQLMPFPSSGGNGLETNLISVMQYVEAVWWYNPATSAWLSYSPGGAADSLTTMDYCKGYWVKLAATAPDSTLTIYGKLCPTGPGGIPPTCTIATADWTMVGFKSTAVRDVDLYLSGDADPASRTYSLPVYEWNAATQAYVPIGDGANMTPGLGYWVNYNSTDSFGPGCE